MYSHKERLFLTFVVVVIFVGLMTMADDLWYQTINQLEDLLKLLLP